MALIIKDRIKEGTTTTGTGDISLAGASATFNPFSYALNDGDTTYYAIAHSATGVNEWEVGIGTYTVSTNSLSRDTIFEGSNSSSPVDFSAGVKNIFITYPSDRAVYVDTSGAVQPTTTLMDTIKANDGTGSGVDADTVDGIQGADIALLAGATFTGAVVAQSTLTGDLTGNASTATTLATSRIISLTGDLAGQTFFNGSSNVSINATVNDDSHAHIIANVDGLQTALDAKADDSTTITAGTGLTGGGTLGVNTTLSLDTTYADDRYVNATGDTMTGDLTVTGGSTVSGNFGVGTLTPVGYGTSLHLNDSATGTQGSLHLTNASTGAGTFDGTYLRLSGSDFLIENREAGDIEFETSGITRMKLNSNGDLLFSNASSGAGQNAPGIGNPTAGVALNKSNYIATSRTGATPLYVNRSTTTGILVDFRYNGSAIGTIRTNSSDIILTSVFPSGGGIRLDSSAPLLLATDYLGAVTTGELDIGSSAYRFKSLAVSDGINYGDATIQTVAGITAVQVTYLTAGTAATFTAHPNAKFFRVSCTGGGGSGGGADGDGASGSAAGGGGSAGTAIKAYTAEEMGATATYTIGAGGVTSGSASGTTGAASTFAPSGTGGSITGNGGGGGNGTAVNNAANQAWNGGNGGSASGGDVNQSGSGGGAGIGFTGAECAAGSGGSSIWGGAGKGVGQATRTAGSPANANTGSGGGGAICGGSTSAIAGGAGGSGIIEVVEYIYI